MSILFTPISIGSMTVKNRFVRSATQDWFGDDQGHLTDRSYAFYDAMAKGDVGLIMSRTLNLSWATNTKAVDDRAVSSVAVIRIFFRPTRSASQPVAMTTMT